MTLEQALTELELEAWTTGADRRIDEVVGTSILGYIADAVRIAVRLRWLLNAPKLDRHKLKETSEELRQTLDCATDAAEAMFMHDAFALVEIGARELGGYPPKPQF